MSVAVKVLPNPIKLSSVGYAKQSEEEDNVLLLEATRRLANNREKATIPMETVMRHLGITEEDIENAQEPVIG